MNCYVGQEEVYSILRDLRSRPKNDVWWCSRNLNLVRGGGFYLSPGPSSSLRFMKRKYVSQRSNLFYPSPFQSLKGAGEDFLASKALVIGFPVGALTFVIDKAGCSSRNDTKRETMDRGNYCCTLIVQVV